MRHPVYVQNDKTGYVPLWCTDSLIRVKKHNYTKKKAKFIKYKKGKIPYFRFFSTTLVHQSRDFSCGPARTCPKIWWRRRRNLRWDVAGSGFRGKTEKVNNAQGDYRGGVWAFWAVPSKETKGAPDRYHLIFFQQLPHQTMGELNGNEHFLTLKGLWQVNAQLWIWPWRSQNSDFQSQFSMSKIIRILPFFFHWII